MQEQIMGLVRNMFTALKRIDRPLVRSLLAEAETAGLLQQLLSAVNHKGLSPLHAAAECDDSQLVSALLAAGALVDAAPADSGLTALHMAAGKGHLESVRVLLSGGAAVDAAFKAGSRDSHKWTALMAALCHGHDDVVYELRAAGATLQADAEGDFAALAIMLDKDDILQPLLAQLQASTADKLAGWTISLDKGHLLQQLFDAGADKGAALRAAAGQRSAAALKIMLDLVAAGVDVDAADEKGRTALHLAAFKGWIQGVALLLAAGAAVDRCTDPSGFTVLHCATGGGEATAGGRPAESRSIIVELLLQAGAPAGVAKFLGDRQKVGGTPLDLAAGAGDAAAVRALCRHLAADGTAAVDQLQAVYGYAMGAAISYGHAGAVRELLAVGADPNHTTQTGNMTSTALEYAAYEGSPAVIACFLQQCSPLQLTATVLLDAAARGLKPRKQSDVPQGLDQVISSLLRAAVERSDSTSVFTALQPATATSSAAIGVGKVQSALLGHFARLMVSMCGECEDELMRHSAADVQSCDPAPCC